MSAKFVWYDINTHDYDTAKAFYGALFGWNFVDWVPEGAPEGTPPYTTILVGELPVGGLVRLPDDVEVPSHWMGHIAVPDVDAAVDRATKRGARFPAGKVDIATVGRFAPMLDPEGAIASLFTPSSAEPMRTPEPGTPGTVGWNELVVANPDQARDFYSAVVGWKWRKAPMDGFDYHLFGTGEAGGDAGGMMQRTPEMPVSCWVPYLTVTSADQALARVRELGGNVMAEPFDVPGVGRLAVCAATDGSAFAVAEWRMGD